MKNTGPYSLTITLRDIQILEMVYRYDGCSIEQIWQRFFPSPGARSAVYLRLSKLHQQGYLHAHQLPSLSGRGSGKTFITLGHRGRALLSEHLDLPLSELKRGREVAAPMIGAHHLAIGSFRLNLELACEREQIELEWVSERELRQPPIIKVADPKLAAAAEDPSSGIKAPLIPLIADGLFTLTLADGSSQSFQLEMDMGTIPAPRLQAKLRGYLSLCREQPRLILWVVPDQRRAQALLGWARQEASTLQADPTVFWVATAAAIAPETILSPIWQVAGVEGLQALVPADHEVVSRRFASLPLAPKQESVSL